MAYHRHLFAQARGLGALISFVSRGPGKGGGPVPGPEHREIVTSPSRDLARDFVRFSGGDPSQHGDTVSPLMFPQWSLAGMLQAASTLPYPPVKVLNAGFRLQIDGPVPPASRLAVASRLLEVTESERGARVRIGVDTSLPEGPSLLRAELRVAIPEPKKSSDATRPASERKEKPRVPNNARVLVERRLRATAGRDFAELTGDFNPIHWLGPYARAMRFRNVILHGFGTAAIAFEAVGQKLLSGRFDRIRSLDVDFVRPLVLPATVGVFVVPEAAGVQLFVGDALSGPAYLTGHCELRDQEPPQK